MTIRKNRENWINMYTQKKKVEIFWYFLKYQQKFRYIWTKIVFSRIFFCIVHGNPRRTIFAWISELLLIRKNVKLFSVCMFLTFTIKMCNLLYLNRYSHLHTFHWILSVFVLLLQFVCLCVFKLWTHSRIWNR